MVRRHGDAEEEDEETKAEENHIQVMIKSKKDQENHLINQRFNVIIVKISVILLMNARMKRSREYKKNRRI